MKNSTTHSVAGLKKLFLISVSILMLSACGGSSNSAKNPDPQNTDKTQKTAIQKISSSTNNDAIILSLQDYKNAGVVGVTATNIKKVNSIIVDLQPKDVDTKAEIQSIVDKLKKVQADTTAPVITLKGETNASLILGSAYAEAGASVIDNKDKSIKVVITGNVNINKLGKYTLTYTATDKAGNKATKTRTVTIILPPDTEKPIISLTGDSTVTISQGAAYSDAGATATDTKDGNVTVLVKNPVDTHASGKYTISYSANDAAGNVADPITRTVIVQPKTTGDLDQYAQNVFEYSSQYSSSSWSALQVLGESNTSSYGDHSTSWTTKSGRNNMDEFITVVYSEAVKSTGVTIRETYGNGFITKVDVLDVDNTLHTVWSGTDPSKQGEVIDFVVSWDKTTYLVKGVKLYLDTSHSSSWEEIDSIKLHGFGTGVAIDSKAPILTLNGSASQTIEVNSTYEDTGATAIDDKDGEVNVVVTGSVDTTKKATYTLTYTATDAAGNSSTKTKTVIVVGDATKPVITLNGEALITIIKGSNYSEAGATATDNKDGEVSVSHNETVDTSKIGVYLISYSATDQAGNASSIKRTVRVVDGSAVKVNAVVDGGNIQVSWSDMPASEHWIALVAEDKANTTSYKTYFYTRGKISGTGSFDVDLKTEEQRFVLTVFKSSGYEKLYISAPFIIKKLSDVPDTEKPVITLNGAGTVSLAPDSTYTDAGATVTDDRDDNLTVTKTGAVNSAQEGTYVITYTARDQAGNTATETRTVIVEIPRAFITTWKTDNEGISNNNQIRIDSSGSGYNFSIDWGDGTVETGRTGRTTHTYDSAGIYTVKITGDFPYFENSDNKKLLTVEQWGTVVWQSMKRAFDNTPNLAINASDAPVLSDVTDMSEMFYNAIAFNSNISHWDVSNVTNMYRMFRNAKTFNQPLNSWNVSNVTNMSEMFYNTDAFNQALNDWNVSKVSNMSQMFYYAKLFNQALNSWNVSSVKNISGMFAASAFNQAIGTWDVSKVENMSSLFSSNQVFDQAISNWDVSSVENMNYLFQSCAFNQPIGNWDVSKVTEMNNMFYRTSAFNQDISNWDVSNVTKMNSMFYDTTAFDQDISNWNVSNVTQMNRMFSSADAFNQPIGNWDVSNVTIMYNMFESTLVFNQAIGNWDVSKVTDMRQMFYRAKAFNQNIDAWSVSDETQITNMFRNADAMDNFPTWYLP